MLTENQEVERSINYLKELRRKLQKDTSLEDRQEIDSMIQYWIKKRRKFGQPKAAELGSEFVGKSSLSKQPRASREKRRC